MNIEFYGKENPLKEYQINQISKRGNFSVDLPCNPQLAEAGRLINRKDLPCNT